MADGDKTTIIKEGGSGGAVALLAIVLIVLAVVAFLLFGQGLISGKKVDADVKITAPSKS